VKPRWGTIILGALLLAEGLGKLADPRGYVDALAGFQLVPASALWPIGMAWIAAELVFGVVLLVAGSRRVAPRQLALFAASGALVLQLGYATLSFSAWFRGIRVDNCTCFGVYLSQRLSLFVLAQDVYMLVFSTLQVRRWRLQ
jgi:hypothetical protein